MHLVCKRLQTTRMATDTKSRRENFRRRRKNFVKRASEISSAFDAKVYVVIFKNDKFYTFKSTKSPSWPPSKEEIVSHLNCHHVGETDLPRNIAIPFQTKRPAQTLRTLQRRNRERSQELADMTRRPRNWTFRHRQDMAKTSNFATKAEVADGA